MRSTIWMLVMLLAVTPVYAGKKKRVKQVEKEADPCEIPIEPPEADNVTPPKVTHRVMLLDLASLQQWGPVELVAVVDCKGKAKQVEVVSPKNPRAARQALQNFKRWRFEPATLEDRPVAFSYRLKMDAP